MIESVQIHQRLGLVLVAFLLLPSHTFELGDVILFDAECPHNPNMVLTAVCTWETDWFRSIEVILETTWLVSYPG